MGSNSSTGRSKRADNQILNSYQKSIIRNAWRHMSTKGPANCGGTITRRMMARQSAIGNVLEKSTIDYHNQQIVEFLQKVMQNLDNPTKISEICQQIGQSHAKYKKRGMKIDFWDKLGEAITETIREYQGWKIHRESLQAATILVSYLIDQMRFGFSRGLHVKTARDLMKLEDQKDQNEDLDQD
ncbi:unnamed protein product [Caenorhabditis bovis]|uniref:Globin domain-containing protein n=1 Tax=Caenorhabditis bovis TaxID=2654633 RepID=A0A8S1FAR7_9PELO|nr:unnamed protein product [Caenorhabditis bovis]